MNWKESKIVGVVALLLVIAAVVAIVFFAKSQTGGGPYQYYLCDSTGELFKVPAVPSNKDYMRNYVGVGPGAPALCKICNKIDAFRAERAGGDKWTKQYFAYFKCDSTGGMFNVTVEPDLEGYDRQFLQNPGEPVKCLVCDKEDANMVRLDTEGNWVKVQPGESLEVPEELPEGVTPQEVTGEEVGWDAIAKREAEKTGEEPARGEDIQADRSDETPAETEPAQPDAQVREESSQDVEDTGTDSEPPQQ